MKRKLLSVAVLGMALGLNAQIFNAGFEDNNGTPMSTFKTVNRDGNTVPVWAEVQDFNEKAWIQFYEGYDNKIAFSTSYYDNYGTSDDWLITPAITIPNEGNPTLYWKGMSYDFDYPDSYKIMISETNDEVESFTTELTRVENEMAFMWTSHSFDLSAYKGKTIHIAFVNNTTDGFYLALDDVYISKSNNCIMPETHGISYSNLKPHSFNIEWFETEGISDYGTKLATFDNSFSEIGKSHLTSKSFSNLEAGKRYQFFINNDDCGSGWTTPYSIFTPSELPYSYGFEKTVENYGEYDSDGWTSNTWINGENETAAQEGSGYVFNNTSKSYDKNDWIFSYPIYLAKDDKISINAYAALSLEDADAATLKVGISKTTEVSDIAEIVGTYTISSVDYKNVSAQFEAPEEGGYYVAFGNVTPKVETTASLRLDNVSIQKGELATSETQKSTVDVFPNPVIDVLNIQSNDELKSVEVYAQDGKLVNKTTSKTINFSNLPKGLYIIKITTKNGTQTKKIIK